MAEFRFDRDYHNLEQVRAFMPAYRARYHELLAGGRYPYNDDFRGYLGIEADQRNEDSAIYLCQVWRRRDELAEKVERALADGFVPVEAVTEPLKCAAVIYYGFEMHDSGYKEWHDVKLAPGLTGLAVMRPRARTRGVNLLGGHVLVKVA